MLFSPIRASLLVLAASAVPVSATPSLTLKTSTPNVSVDGLEPEVTTTIINTGDETLKLLNDPRGVLDSFPENSFTIADISGSRPSFTGAKIKYSPTYAADLDPRVFTGLAPGASIDVTHDRESGSGHYSINPSNFFIHVGGNGTPKVLHTNTDSVVVWRTSASRKSIVQDHFRLTSGHKFSTFT